MTSFRFTEPFVRNVTTDHQKEVCEDGLCLRIYPSGRKAWFVTYRNTSGRFRRVKLGIYPAVNLKAARRLARLRRAEVAEGRDPQEERLEARIPTQTFADLAALYISDHAKPNKRTWGDDERIIKKDLLPAWGSLPAKEIRRRDVADRVQAIMKRGAPIQANRTLALIGKIFAFALEREMVELNPRVGLSLPAKEKPRSRFLDEEEIQVLWEKLDLLNPVMASIYRFLLLTGQRSNTVVNLRHDHVSGDVWTVPSVLMKSGRTHRVFLSEQALSILRDNQLLVPDSPWGFPSWRKPGAPIQNMGKSLAELQSLCGFHFTRHDLRRTCATHLARLGCPRHLLTQVLDHADKSVTSIYDRYSYDEELREWMGTWGREVERLTGVLHS